MVSLQQLLDYSQIALNYLIYLESSNEQWPRKATYRLLFAYISAPESHAS